MGEAGEERETEMEREEEEEKSRLSPIRPESRHSAQELVLASGTHCPPHETT